MKSRFPVALSLVLFSAFSSAAAPPVTKIIHLPGEVEGQTYSVEVENRRIAGIGGSYRYLTVEREQKIETRQVSLTLSSSPLLFSSDGKFVGLIPYQGTMSGTTLFDAFKIDDDLEDECPLKVGPNFSVQSVCASYSVKIRPVGSDSFDAFRGRLELRSEGGISQLRYRPETFMLGMSENFPTIQGESLMPGPSPGGGAIFMAANMAVLFSSDGYIRAIHGSLWSVRADLYRASKAPMNLDSTRLGPQVVWLWKNDELDLEVTSQGLVSGARLKEPVTREVMGESQTLDIYVRDTLGRVDSSYYSGPLSSGDPMKWKGMAVLDPTVMGLITETPGKWGGELCTRLGTPYRRDPMNPITESIFYSVARANDEYRVTSSTKFYDPASNRAIQLRKGMKVVLLTELECPTVVSVPL